MRKKTDTDCVLFENPGLGHLKIFKKPHHEDFTTRRQKANDLGLVPVERTLSLLIQQKFCKKQYNDFFALILFAESRKVSWNLQLNITFVSIAYLLVTWSNLKTRLFRSNNFSSS